MVAAFAKLRMWLIACLQSPSVSNDYVSNRQRTTSLHNNIENWQLNYFIDKKGSIMDIKSTAGLQ